MYIVRAIKREIEASESISDKSLPHLSNSQIFYLDSLQKLDEIRSRGFQIDAVNQNQIFTVPHQPDIGPAAEVERAANWGAENLRVQEFWKLKARGQSVKVGIADTGIFRDHDCLIVFAASGNEYTSQSQPHTRSPGNYPLEGLISVGAYNNQQNIWAASGGGIIDWPDTSFFSGKKNVIVPYLASPGVEIISCTSEKGKYRNETGTSAATPHMAGIAANILSYIRMKGLANEKILTKQIIDNAIVDAGQPGSDERYGKGLLSIDKILAQLQSLTT